MFERRTPAGCVCYIWVPFASRCDVIVHTHRLMAIIDWITQKKRASLLLTMSVSSNCLVEYIYNKFFCISNTHTHNVAFKTGVMND